MTNRMLHIIVFLLDCSTSKWNVTHCSYSNALPSLKKMSQTGLVPTSLHSNGMLQNGLVPMLYIQMECYRVTLFHVFHSNGIFKSDSVLCSTLNGMFKSVPLPCSIFNGMFKSVPVPCSIFHGMFENDPVPCSIFNHSLRCFNFIDNSSAVDKSQLKAFSQNWHSNSIKNTLGLI